MKKLALVLIAICISATSLFAQKSNVAKASVIFASGNVPTGQDLKSAKEAIDAAVVNETTKEFSKAWFVRGQVYQTINRDALGKQHTEIDPDALPKAYESYLKALELGKKEMVEKAAKKGKEPKPYKDKDEILAKLKELSGEFKNKGIGFYQEGDNANAVEQIEIGLAIDEMEGINVVDSTFIYYAGVLSDAGEMPKKAQKFYTKAIEIGYGHDMIETDSVGKPKLDENGAVVRSSKVAKETFFRLGNSYMASGDTAKAVETYEKGMAKYSDAGNILVTLINYYLNANKTDKAKTYLEKAMKDEPQNDTYVFAYGAVFDPTAKGDMPKDEAKANALKALEYYEKAIKLNPENSDANYNIGVIYYNFGAAILDDASSIPQHETAKYNAKREEALVEFKKAQPYFERVLELKPDEKGAMNSLAIIYGQLGMEKEAENMMKRMGGE